MGAPITITVYWDESTGAPTADDTTVHKKNGATVLQWEGNSTIDRITGINGLPDGPGGEFTTPQSKAGEKKKWTATDKATQTGHWDYTIAATKADGTAGKSDPRITNDDE